MSSENTLVLYIFIFVITTLYPLLFRRNSETKWEGLFVPFIIHWFFCCFTNIGVDYQNYYRIIENIGTSSAFEGVEIGFTWICIIFKALSFNPDQIIFLLKTLTVVLFYRGFYKLRKTTIIPLAILSYNVLIYLQGFYLLSMQLAIALLFLSVIHLLFGTRNKSVFYILMACLVHTSSILLLPIYVILMYMQRKKALISVRQICILICVMASISVCFTIIYDYAINSIPIFQYYVAYELSDTDQATGSGLGQIVFYLPIFYFILQIYRSNLSSNIKNGAVIFSIVGFTYALLGYKVEVLMRINESFFCLYAIFIPLLFYKRTTHAVSIKQTRFPIRLEQFVWVLYLSFRGYIVVSGYMSEDSLSEISEFHFFNPLM